MKTYQIENKKDLHTLIDLLGQKKATMDAERAECNAISAVVRAWIDEHPEDAKGETKDYSWRMRESKRSVGLMPEYDLATVLDMLRQEDGMVKYIIEDLDRDALRKDYPNASKRAELEAFGIRIESAKKTLAVEALK